MIKFRQKDFSNYIVRDAIKGAGLGASAGVLLGGLGFAPESINKKWIPEKARENYNKLRPDKEPYTKWNDQAKKMEIQYRNSGNGKYVNKQSDIDGSDKEMIKRDTAPGATQSQKYIFALTTTILGAALGAIVGAIRTAKDAARVTNQRLLKQVLPRLKSKGLVEGKDFTMDPKKANEIPTKVCIVLSSASGELQTVINSKDDPKLKKVVDGIVRKSPGRAQVTTQNNRFNEITITTEKRTAANVNQVVSIIESFVESGYPVYIVEVG